VDTKTQIEREPVLLQRVLPTVVARNEARDPARTYRLEISQDLPPVLASPSIVDQVLDNLVGNSRKYATAGTAIEVSARHGEDGAVLTVRDRGRVMSAAEVERFFEPFYRDAWASSTAGGSGLGLSVCARLAQVVGGSIAATPREGGGLEVSVTLPYAPEDIESDQEASSALKR
jgi:signal transduction histidine kinase